MCKHVDPKYVNIVHCTNSDARSGMFLKYPSPRPVSAATTHAKCTHPRIKGRICADRSPANHRAPSSVLVFPSVSPLAHRASSFAFASSRVFARARVPLAHLLSSRVRVVPAEPLDVVSELF
jgi:hypothetical protein